MPPTKMTPQATPRPSSRPGGGKPRPRLTPRQQAVWEWMIGFQRAHCAPPSLRQICEQFGFRSTQASVSHLRALVRKGFVMHVGSHGTSRAYLAIFGDDRCPCCGRKPMGTSEFARRINEPDPGESPMPPTPIDTIPSASPVHLVAK